MVQPSHIDCEKRDQDMITMLNVNETLKPKDVHYE